jgi:hypothetical protein
LAALEPSLKDVSGYIGYICTAQGYFNSVKKLEGGAKQANIAAKLGLAMTEDFLLLYGTLSSGQETIMQARSAYAQATIDHEKVIRKISEVNAQISLIGDEMILQYATVTRRLA